MQDPQFIDVDGIRTRVFRVGSGTPILLIHGGNFGTTYNAYHWSRNFDGLCADFEVIAPDKIGQGYTDNPETEADYTMTRVIDHIRSLMRILEPTGVVLVGHSRGALPAARMALEQPDNVRALIVADSNTLAIRNFSTPDGFYAKLDKSISDVPDEEYVTREPAANSHTTGHITPDFVQEMVEIARLPKIVEARETMGRLREKQFIPDMLAQKTATLDLIRDKGLDVPTLVVWGARDPSAPVASGYDLFQHIGMTGARCELHVFADAGHYAFREHAQAFNRLVADFVAAA